MKNKSKAISLYKYNLGKLQVFKYNVFLKKIDLNLEQFFHSKIIVLFLEFFFLSLTKASKSFYRFHKSNKKRKSIFLFNCFGNNLLPSKLFFNINRIKKIKYKKTIVCLKKRIKYRFKFYRIKHKFFLNSLAGAVSFFSKGGIYSFFVNVGVLWKKKYFAASRYFAMNNKNVFLKKKKIMLLQLFFFKNLIEQYFFFLLLIPLKIFFFNFISYKTCFYLNFRDKYLQEQLKQKKIRKLRVMGIKKKDFFYNKLIYLSKLAFRIDDITLFIKQCCERLTKIHKHKYALKQFREIVQLANILNFNNYGIRIVLFGKINAKTRAKRAIIQYCKIPSTHTLVNHSAYSYLNSFSYTGVFGLHLWFVKKHIN